MYYILNDRKKVRKITSKQEFLKKMLSILPANKLKLIMMQKVGLFTIS